MKSYISGNKNNKVMKKEKGHSMGFDLEMNNYLLHKDEEKIMGYFAGDNVICEAGGKRYIGKIASIGYYREEEGAEPKPAIYIDTTKGRKSYSGEVIMLDDITYLYNDTAEYKSEAMGGLIEILLDKWDDLAEQEKDRAGKILMWFWNLAEQKS